MKLSSADNGETYNSLGRLQRKGREHIILPFKIMSSTNTGLSWKDFGVVLSQHAVVSRPALHVNLFLPHHTRLTLLTQQAPQTLWLLLLVMATVHIPVWNVYASHLVVKVPGLIVFLCAFPAKNWLVVNLDELPFRTMTEVSKEAARGKGYNYFQSKATILWQSVHWSSYSQTPGHNKKHHEW